MAKKKDNAEGKAPENAPNATPSDPGKPSPAKPKGDGKGIEVKTISGSTRVDY
ncbi:hypothetical protein [Desulfovibrio oxyclinae]|uniref:hypothetical protein n=1 Tax=Desulfovibrio oxyclinae TaxID=63560 RepID=UPI000374B45C|nr:hypothetical protein [Desulfovibrio oxyclinae]